MTVLYAGDYGELVTLMQSARDPKKGRPTIALMRWREGEDHTYELVNSDRKLMTYHPDNTVTIHIPPVVRSFFLGNLGRITPFWLTGQLPHGIGFRGDSNIVHTYDGLRADLTTRQFLNPLPPLTERVDKSKRKEWLDKRRAFLDHMKTLHRLGALDALGNKPIVIKARDDIVDILYAMIEGGCRDTEKVEDLLYYVGSKASYASLVNRHSLELRLRMGVFTQGDM